MACSRQLTSPEARSNTKIAAGRSFISRYLAGVEQLEVASNLEPPVVITLTCDADARRHGSGGVLANKFDLHDCSAEIDPGGKGGQ
jgi:hypothetical protein